MTSTTVVGITRRARMPGEGAALPSDEPIRDTGHAASLSAQPLVDPEGVERVLPRRRQPARVQVGASPAPVVLAAPAPTPQFTRAPAVAQASPLPAPVAAPIPLAAEDMVTPVRVARQAHPEPAVARASREAAPQPVYADTAAYHHPYPDLDEHEHEHEQYEDYPDLQEDFVDERQTHSRHIRPQEAPISSLKAQAYRLTAQDREAALFGAQMMDELVEQEPIQHQASPRTASVRMPAAPSRPAPRQAQGSQAQARPAQTHGPLTRGSVKSTRTPQAQATQAKRPATAPTRSSRQGPAIHARNTAVGLMFAYLEHASVQIGRPLNMVIANAGLLIVGALHILAPLMMCFGMAHFFPETFMQGGVVANLGKLFCLYLACAFAWSLIFISCSWLNTNVRQGAARFERIGRGIFSPNSKD